MHCQETLIAHTNFNQDVLTLFCKIVIIMRKRFPQAGGSMSLDYWRDYDLKPRKQKITNAFRLAEIACAEDIPIIISDGYPIGAAR